MRNKMWRERLKLAFKILRSNDAERDIREEEFLLGRGEVLGDYKKFRDEIIPFFKEWEERIRNYDDRGIGVSDRTVVELYKLPLRRGLVDYQGGIMQDNSLTPPIASGIPPEYVKLHQTMLAIQLKSSCWQMESIKNARHEAARRLTQMLLEGDYLKYDIQEIRGEFVITFYISTYNV